MFEVLPCGWPRSPPSSILTGVLAIANYIAVAAVSIRARWPLMTDKRRLLTKALAIGELLIQFVVIAVPWMDVAMLGPQSVRIVSRKSVSATRAHEK